MLALVLCTGPLLSAQTMRSRGFFANFSASYDHAFSGDGSTLCLTPYDLGLLTQSEYWFLHQSMLIQLPLNANLFDVYMALGITIYPFKDILSITVNAGISLSNITLNHFTYIGNIRTGTDILVFKNYSRHFLSLGTGVRHRNSILLLDYIQVSSDYLKLFNSFFFDIAYRIRM
ncbi:MAG: hypothetical protein LBI85_01945 [Spirochaetaceae bacterium]|jgi:hypothetical protein|nr:hypothetical protein [Spirochaetaceae bacterium]